MDMSKEWIGKIKRHKYVAILAGLAVAAGTGMALDRNVSSSGRQVEVVPVRLEVDASPVKRTDGMTTSFSPVVKQVTPSVVKITTTREMAMNEMPGMMPYLDNPFLRRFFEQPGSEGQMPHHRAPKQHGLGSGVIVTKDGYVLTNNHVVKGADEIRVVLSDQREFDAKVVGTDPKTDIAVLKIDGKDLPYAVAGDSDGIAVGDVVLAIGNPFGIGQTVTMGIVSGTGRSTLGLDYEDFIQTDAAINPGNSGGALVDAEGRVIGINTAILSRSGGNNGIGFAVPINLARNVMESLIEHGHVIRGYLGVYIQDLNPELAKAFGLKETQGALVSEVMPDGPAAQAGLKSGDVITSFDGHAVDGSRELKLQVAQTEPGSHVAVTVQRDGTAKDLEVVLKELPSDTQLGQAGSRDTNNPSDLLDGVMVGDLDRQVRQQLDLPEDLRQGAVILEVDPDSPAAEAGLQPGDVIQEIDRKPVENAESAVALSENLKGDHVLLKIWSRGGSRYVVVNAPHIG